MRAETETVYNIKVDGDHCWRVGEQGMQVHNASVGSISSPAVVADGSCCPKITIASPSVFRMINTKKEMNYIHGELDGGELRFGVYNEPKNDPQDGCPGKWMFEQMWDHFGGSNISAIEDLWISGDNLRVFNEQIAAGKTKKQAAWFTWTGMRATEKNFTNVNEPSTDPGSGPYTQVVVTFTR